MAGLDSVAKVKKLVYDSVFKRALDIASSNSLHGVSFEGDDLGTCNAECIGSSSTDIYKLNANVIGDKATGKCSCPASSKAKDGLCKHIVALLLRRIDRLREKSASRIRARTQEADADEYPIENIGTPEEEAVASPPHMREQISDENGSKLGTPGAARMQSSSKRALPAWMVGVVGSVESGETSKTTKPKRKTPVHKPPRAPPPPTKRARRHGQPLRVSNDLGEEEGPGEIDVAGPVDEPLDEEAEEPVVEDGEEFHEPISERRPVRPIKPVRPRSRHGNQLLKQSAGEIESNNGDENVGSRRGRSRAQRGSKSRRVVGKLFEVESDLSDNDRIPSSARNGGGAVDDITDDDLILLAREHVANENGGLAEKSHLENRSVIPSEEKKVSDKQTAAKSTSMYSLHNWKELSSQVDAAAPLGNANSLDLETLKSYSLRGDTQNTGLHLEDRDIQGTCAGDEAFPSLRTRSAAEGESMTAPDADKDSVANDMLDLIFGSSLSASVVSQSPVPPKEVSVGIGGDHSSRADKFRSVDASSSKEWSSRSSAPGVTTAVMNKNSEDVSGEFKPKKGSSLKDRVRMLLD